MNEQWIGADIGGTFARVAVSTGSIDRVDRQSEFRVTNNYRQDVSQLIKTMKQLMEENEVRGIGLGLPGSVDNEQGVLTISTYLGDWIGQPIVADLKREFNCRVCLLNDADAGALAEATLEDHSADFWYVTWGTGIGSSIIKLDNDKIDITDSELGHHIISDYVECACGRRGCFEAHVGGYGLEKYYRKPASELTREEWLQVIEWMSIGLYNAVMLYPVEEIVLSGGITNKQLWTLPLIEKKLNQRLDGFRVVQIKPAAQSNLLGTLLAARTDL